MRIVATLYNPIEMESLANLGADAFLVNVQGLSTKTRAVFSLSEVSSIINLAHQAGKLVYVNINVMIEESTLAVLREFLGFLKTEPVDGIVCFDLTVLTVALEFGLGEKIIYRPGTLNTNVYDPWFFRKMKVKGITLSKDITLEELVSIGENYQGMDISLVGHGYLFLFYSKRRLLKNYFDHKKIFVPNFLEGDTFRLAEKARQEGLYPIYEDRFGTHIFRAKKLQSLDEIDVLRPYLSDFFVERMFLPDQEYFDSIAVCAGKLEKSAFLIRYGKEYDHGFYYLKTVSKKGAPRS